MQIDGTNARRKRLVPKTRSERTNNLRGSESHYQAHDREQINRIRAHETKTAHDRMQRVRPSVRARSAKLAQQRIGGAANSLLRWNTSQSHM